MFEAQGQSSGVRVEVGLRVLVFAGGLYLIVQTLLSAIRAFILPRAVADPLVRVAFLVVRWLFDLRIRRLERFEERDRIFAYYAPVSLVLLPFLWLTMTVAGYALMLWAIEQGSVWETVRLSGSSVLTLGFASTESRLATVVAFTAAAVGLLLVAVLISYLPTIYSAYSAREREVAMIMVRAGTPPSAAMMIERYQRLGGLDRMDDLWGEWEQWFALLAETHTSLAVLNFYRSPRVEYTWLTAAGTVLDAAAILTSAVDVPRNPQRELCLRSGFLALCDIADYFSVTYDRSPSPTDPISITREEFEAVVGELTAAGVPMRADREQCWADFRGWRVNYDRVLLVLAELTMAPSALWISDRSPVISFRPPILGRRRLTQKGTGS